MKGHGADPSLGPRPKVDKRRIARFCERHRIREFFLFGSILTDAFGPHSDVDVMIDPRRDTAYGLRELADMQDELEVMFGRRVDLVTKRAILRSRNEIRKRSILAGASVIHVAA